MAQCASPRVGVVVPTLNEATLLPRLLARLTEGACEQDRADAVIVVDGGSSDGTPQLARAAGVRVLSGEPGRGQQLAAGAAALECGWLLFLHADCLPAPGAIAALRRAALGAGVELCGMSQRIEAEGWFYRRVEAHADRRVRRRGMVYGDSGLFVRRSLYAAVGGFRRLPLFEDVDISRRLRSRAHAVLVSDARLLISARRWQREGALRATLRNWMIRTAFAAGVSAQRLKRFYAPETSSGPSV